MSNNFPQNRTSDVLGDVIEVNVGGVVEVNGSLIGRSIIDGFRSKFSHSSQTQEGDYYMDRSRDLLRRHLRLIEVDDHDMICQSLDELS
jgi:hypothetical protein